MPETIEDTIAHAKEQKRKAAMVDATQELAESGVMPDSTGEKTVSAFERTVANVTDAMHTSLTAELVELHSFIPEKLLSSVYEIALIPQPAYKEQRFMSGYSLSIKGDMKEWKKTGKNILDRITWLQNEVLVQEMLENARILMRQLAALNGYRSEQGVKNVASAVSGESARLAAQNPMLFPSATQNTGVRQRIMKWITGK